MQNYVLYDLTQRLPLLLYIHMDWNFFFRFLYLYSYTISSSTLCRKRVFAIYPWDRDF